MPNNTPASLRDFARQHGIDPAETTSDHELAMRLQRAGSTPSAPAELLGLAHGLLAGIRPDPAGESGDTD
jgi:hypothetical protein